ncbi:MAG TPA: cation-translocating P-type ATPase [Chitinophagales bacterium]|nr:cation-translocating P-type ATPase [Chitinophagales bacterium]
MSYQTPDGLSSEEVLASRKLHGSNVQEVQQRNLLVGIILEIVAEPLFILLSVTMVLYFILGEIQEGLILMVALGIVSGISIFQEQRSRNAVNALKDLTSPRTQVIRNKEQISIHTDEIVVGDIILLEDGNIIPADATILFSRDLTVNESALTGESLSLYKSADSADNLLFQGTTIVGGSATATVTAIGLNTRLGEIGAKLSDIAVQKTPLQLQIRKFIQSMVIVGVIAFLIVCIVNYLTSKNIIHSLLHGLTLAMSILPEEIPVAFSTFMALGAFHLYKKNVIAKSPYTVETLGAATVICSDKTGTITENLMKPIAIYDAIDDNVHDFNISRPAYHPLIEFAMWASEPEPFDQMEKQIHQLYTEVALSDLRLQFSMVHEYPLDGTPPIMTHVFFNDNEYKIGCKGGLETLLPLCNADKETIQRVTNQAEIFTGKGFRVLAVAKAAFPENGLPARQNLFSFDLLGLIAFYDPPKAKIKDLIQTFYQAGIQFKMITGDHAATAISIADIIGMQHNGKILSGNEVMQMSDAALSDAVESTHIYARMFPDAKLRIVEALKAKGEIVAMTGDGVNDAPALKAAHIGVAMGKRGTETAKKAAALILVDDDLMKMADAVALGRRIYENLKKAIRYIISIHVPIILIVTLPLLLGWAFTDIFQPIHVIFLELIMGPTCSIVYENEPIEKGSMQRKPRKMSMNFFSWQELNLSIIQGLAITIACLGLGYYFMQHQMSDPQVRTAIFSTLLFSNVLLTLTNRSFTHSILHTLKYKNKLIPIILSIAMGILVVSLTIEPVRNLFHFEMLTFSQLITCLCFAIAGVLWIEIYKILKTVNLTAAR